MPRSRGSQAYLVLLLAVLVGLVLVVSGVWRLGITVLGGTFVAASVLRVVVPQDHVGMLRVRGKTFDVVWTMLLGVSLIVLAAVVPPPPG
ncbi:MAG: DUF3017 domain-containing protein [Aeromicrobium erythreum]